MDSQITVKRLPKRGNNYPIVVAGELDVYGSPHLQQELAVILRGKDSDFGQGDRIVIHTEKGEFASEDGRAFSSAGLEYIDASGLGAMMSGLKRAKERGGSVCLIISDPKIKRIFAITGLDKVFDTFDNPEAAYQTAIA